MADNCSAGRVQKELLILLAISNILLHHHHHSLTDEESATDLNYRCSKFLSKNITLERLLTEFRQDDIAHGGDDDNDELGCEDEARCNDNVHGNADSPLSYHLSEEQDDIEGMKINDTLGYCQVS